MILIVDKSFEKDTDRIVDKSILNKIANCIKNIKNSHEINQIHNLRKLSGFKSFFRIKIGDYRLGIRIDKDTINFIRCLHRKDIYKYFPK